MPRIAPKNVLESKYNYCEITLDHSFDGDEDDNDPYKSKKFYLNSDMSIKCALKIQVVKKEISDDSSIFSSSSSSDEDKKKKVITVNLKFDEKINFQELSVNLNIREHPDPMVFKLKVNENNVTEYDSDEHEAFDCCCGMGCNDLISIHKATIIYILPHDIKTWGNALKNDLESNKFTDFTITLNNDEKIKVHKMVLYYASPVFQKIIDSDMIEANTNNINISNFDKTVVKEMLNFIYGCKCNLSVNIYDLFKIAHLYEIEGLQNKCEWHLINNLNDKNIHDVLSLMNVEWYNLNFLKPAVKKFIVSRKTELINNKEFIDHYLSIMTPNNIELMFEFAMVNKNEEFKSNVNKFIRKNIDKCMKNLEFKKMLEKHSTWAVKFLDYLSKFKSIN